MSKRVEKITIGGREYSKFIVWPKQVRLLERPPSPRRPATGGREMTEDEKATEDAYVIKEGRENAQADWDDCLRMEDPSEVPGIYRDAGRELWWESYNAEYDRLESSQTTSDDRPDA